MSVSIQNKVQIGQNATAANNFVWERDATTGVLVLRRGTHDVGGSELMKFNADGTAVIPGAVGTVSQSGGVPTGAILQYGSNTNGQFRKYADGTLICTVQSFEIAIATANTEVAGTWTFPHAFTAFENIQLCIRNVTSTHGYTVAKLASNDISLTGAAIRLNASAVQTYRISCMTIGRWF